MPIMHVIRVYVISFRSVDRHLMADTPEINCSSLNLDSLDDILFSTKKFLHTPYDTKTYRLLSTLNTVLLILTSISECYKCYICEY